MATSEILPFAFGVGANIEDQATYATDPLRTSGNVAGIAKSALNNKALLQSTLIASAVAKFIADNQANNITDQNAFPDIANWLKTAVQNLSAIDYLNTTRIDVASAATVNLTSSAPNTRHINITGTTAITAFTIAAGQTYFVRFADALTLTNNAGIVTQTGANIVTAAGDTCIIRATAANVVEVLAYSQAIQAAASETVSGILCLATQAMADAGTNDLTAITPKKLGNGFHISLGANGYIKFPSWLGGLIIQWGTVSVSSTGGGATGEGVVTFPVTFPNAARSVAASYELTGGAITGALSLYHRSLSTSGVRFGLDEASATPTTTSVKWIAIGY